MAAPELKFGSLCALGGFTPYPVMSALTHFTEDLGARPPSLEACGMRENAMPLVHETDYGTPRSMGGTSLFFWLTSIGAGRMIGYSRRERVWRRTGISLP
jgi:hypothetical protein